MKEIDLSKMSPRDRAEAKNEVDVLRRLRHPNIVRYQDSFVVGSGRLSMLYIAMDFADGGVSAVHVVNI